MQEIETRTESAGTADAEKQEQPLAQINLTAATVSISTGTIEPLGRPLPWPDEDAEEQEAAEGMRRLSLKALESQWDDDEPDADDL